MTPEETKWYWISRAPMLLCVPIALWLILHGLSIAGFMVGLAGMAVRIFLDPESAK